jgi:hypothetical protein
MLYIVSINILKRGTVGRLKYVNESGRGQFWDGIRAFLGTLEKTRRTWTSLTSIQTEIRTEHDPITDVALLPMLSGNICFLAPRHPMWVMALQGDPLPSTTSSYVGDGTAGRSILDLRSRRSESQHSVGTDRARRSRDQPYFIPCITKKMP